MDTISAGRMPGAMPFAAISWSFGGAPAPAIFWAGGESWVTSIAGIIGRSSR
jgi:hypothetical protein